MVINNLSIKKKNSNRTDKINKEEEKTLEILKIKIRKQKF